MKRILLILSLLPIVIQAQIITTVAGNGTPGFSGDGGAATLAQFSASGGICFDATGNLYIVDDSNYRVRVVNPSGTVSTFAGTGLPGFFGDGGPAMAAQFNLPGNIWIDGLGNKYIIDYFNYRIRKIDPSGIISTIAGNGISGISGDGGLATNAKIRNPADVVTDIHGNVYYADGAHVIRKIDASGIITTIAGTGVFGFSGDGGPATAAKLNTPDGITIDGPGNIYISDANNQRILLQLQVPELADSQVMAGQLPQRSYIILMDYALMLPGIYL
jgi:trimeric autotransporter adhesin